MIPCWVLALPSAGSLMEMTAQERRSAGRSEHPAREVLEDLIEMTGAEESYSLTCEPLDKRFCFIGVHRMLLRRNGPTGECTTLGYGGH